MILAKILANSFQTVLSSLTGSKQAFAVKSRSIQNNLNLVILINEQVIREAALIKFDQSKAFDSIDHRFFEAVFQPLGLAQISRLMVTEL